MVAALSLTLVACGDDDDPGPAATTTSTTEAVGDSTTTTGAAGGTTTTTAADDLVPGQACELGSNPDCIDPDEDGEGTYLIGGADCLEAYVDSQTMCTDLDGDGRAGYPDSG